MPLVPPFLPCLSISIPHHWNKILDLTLATEAAASNASFLLSRGPFMSDTGVLRNGPEIDRLAPQSLAQPRPVPLSQEEEVHEEGGSSCMIDFSKCPKVWFGLSEVE
jgi:hypothetical protein